MKKSLIVLATVGAFAVPSAAMAVDVSFGGEFDVAVQQFDNGKESQNQMNNTHSRFWWDMVDDLGTGLMVKGHLEIDVGASNKCGGNCANAPGDTSAIGNRNSYIGLAGESWGEARFGNQENIHEALGYSVDPFHGAAGPGGNIVAGLGQAGVNPVDTTVVGQEDLNPTNAQFNGLNIGARRTSETITYISPNWSGFTFLVDYSMEGANDTGLEPSANNVDDWTELFYGARYDGQAGFGGWRVYAAGADISGQILELEGATLLIDVGTTLAGTPLPAGNYQMDMSGVRAGGGITFGNFMFDAFYETNEWKGTKDFAGTKIERNGFWLGGSWNIPTGKLALGYISMDDADLNGASVASSASTMIALGYYHTLSANSSLYAIYSTMDNDANAQSQIADGSTVAVGEDPSSISLGMYLVF